MFAYKCHHVRPQPYLFSSTVPAPFLFCHAKAVCEQSVTGLYLAIPLMTIPFPKVAQHFVTQQCLAHDCCFEELLPCVLLVQAVIPLTLQFGVQSGTSSVLDDMMSAAADTATLGSKLAQLKVTIHMGKTCPCIVLYY